MLDIIGIHIDFNLKDAFDALNRIWNEHFPSKAGNNEKLIDSCRTLDLKSVKSLLKKDIDINEPDEHGCTPLILASSKGDNDSVGKDNFHLVKLLLYCDADIEATDHFGNTALIKASRNGAARIVEVLINAGANVNAQNGEGWTGLMRAVKYGYRKTAAVFKHLLSPSAWNNLKEITNNDGDKAIDILRKNRLNMDPEVYNDLLTLLS